MGAAGSGGSGCRTFVSCAAKEEEHRLLVDDDGFNDTSPVVNDKLSVVQFSTPMYYCTEDQGEIRVEVVRLGRCSGYASFDYQTRDGSAKAHHRYVPRRGTMHFSPGESVKAVTIAVVQNSRWDATLEFAVDICAVRGARMGQYLHTCRVSIIDDDTFPTNKYHNALWKNKELESVSLFSLMKEFALMNLVRDEVFWGTVKCVLCDFAKSLYYFMTLYLQFYLVDVVIMGGEEGEEEVEETASGERRLFRGIRFGARLLARALHSEETAEGGEESEGLINVEGWPLVMGSRHYSAIVVGVLYVLPLIFIHWLDSCKINFGVPGHCRKILQENLFRRYLHYEDSARAAVSTGDITMAIMRDVKEVVDMGYMKVLQVARIVLKLSLASVFILSENTTAIVPLAVFPVVMFAFLLLRRKITIESNEEMARCENNVVQTLNNSIVNSQLLADFHLRPNTVDKFEADIDHFNKREMNYHHVVSNNTYVAPWLTTLFIGVWMVFGTFQVQTLGGPLSLGAFLATINIFKEVGTELEEVYHGLMEIQTTAGPLQKLTYYMNSPTDLHQRMKVNAERSRVGAERQAEAQLRSDHGLVISENGDVVFPADTVPIEVSDLTFFRNESRIINKLNRKFDQGKMYAIVGQANQGKGTFLKLLGEVLVPEPNFGHVLMPPQLRVLHLSRDAKILNEGLLSNLIFNQSLEAVGGFERVLQICRRCHFSRETLNYLEASRMDVGMDEAEAAEPGEQPPQTPRTRQAWVRQLSSTDLARLNLARALLMNPECLVMHMPLAMFHTEDTEDMMRVLRAHVDERGIEMPDEDRQTRSLRTIFCTTSSIRRCAAADMVLEVRGGSLVERSKVRIQESNVDAAAPAYSPDASTLNTPVCSVRENTQTFTTSNRGGSASSLLSTASSVSGGYGSDREPAAVATFSPTLPPPPASPPVTEMSPSPDEASPTITEVLPSEAAGPQKGPARGSVPSFWGKLRTPSPSTRSVKT